MHKRPYSHTEISKFVSKRVKELKGYMLQIEIAAEVGFVNPNMMSLIKNGSIKVPLDRVSKLASALDCDPAFLFRLAMDQDGEETKKSSLEGIFHTIVSKNEAVWLKEIRDASENSDPVLTSRQLLLLRKVFGK